MRYLPLLALLGCATHASHAEIDLLVPGILEQDRIPGAVIVVGTKERIEYRRAFGTARLETLFDLASLTKVVGTTTAAMKLVESGRIGLDDPVGKFVKAFAARDITVRELLTHRSGLPAYHKPKVAGAEAILGEISVLSAEKKYRYS